MPVLAQIFHSGDFSCFAALTTAARPPTMRKQSWSASSSFCCLQSASLPAPMLCIVIFSWCFCGSFLCLSPIVITERARALRLALSRNRARWKQDEVAAVLAHDVDLG